MTSKAIHVSTNCRILSNTLIEPFVEVLDYLKSNDCFVEVISTSPSEAFKVIYTSLRSLNTIRSRTSYAYVKSIIAFTGSISGRNDRLQHNICLRIEQFLNSVSEITTAPNYDGVSNKRFVILECISSKIPEPKDDASIQFTEALQQRR